MALPNRNKRAISNASLPSGSPESTSQQPGPSKKRKSERAQTADSDASPNVMHPLNLPEAPEGNAALSSITSTPATGNEWTRVEKRKVKKARKLEVSEHFGVALDGCVYLSTL